MALEVERKYLGVDQACLRHRLRLLGARPLGAHFEGNWVFDTPDNALFASRRLLRLRRQEWPDKVRHVLTLKLPVVDDGVHNCKVREELELNIQDAVAMTAVLQGLGYRVRARYEKIREPWLIGKVEVALDILPFAHVLEIEGPAQALEQAALVLDLDRYTISTKSYHQLHQEWRMSQGLPPCLSFVFSQDKQRDWRESLGLAPDGTDQLMPEAEEGAHAV